MPLESNILDVEILEKEWIQIWFAAAIVMVQKHDQNLSRNNRSIDNPKKLIIARLWVNQPVRQFRLGKWNHSIHSLTKLLVMVLLDFRARFYNLVVKINFFLI